VDVVVTNPGATAATLAGAFTYAVPGATVTAISPTSGSSFGGTAVTITGTSFVTGAAVTIGGTAATGVTVVNATTITATTPTHAAGAVDVVVTNSGTAPGTLSGGYTYIVPVPTVSAISPAIGSTAGGTTVTVTGTNFGAGAALTIGGTAATSVTVVNQTTITATTPAHAAGAVDVVVTNAGATPGTLTGGFTYTVPVATITSITPTGGSTVGGTPFTVTGTNFVSGASVTIGGVAATSVVVVSGTSITGVTGAHAAGAVDVLVTNAGGTPATKAGGFTYSVQAGATRLLPGTYAAGTAFTVTVEVSAPADAFVQAVEDTPPAGWTVSSINNSGAFDAVNGKVKWGPFFDAAPRTLTYVLTPPAGATGTKTFSGLVSFDGADTALGGVSSIGSAAGGSAFLMTLPSGVPTTSTPGAVVVASHHN
jgi:hypothetical protein